MKREDIRTRHQCDTPFYPNMLNNGLVEVCLKEDVDRFLYEKYAEIAELKAKLEDAKASHYAEMVDAGMRERRLNRALYRVLALWANERARLTWSWRKEQGWLKMERKCRAMADKWR